MTWTVVLFKAKPSEGDTVDKDRFLTHLKCIESNQLRVEGIGVLDFEFVALDILFEALENIGQYEGLILTSPRCVESIRRCIDLNEETREKWEVNLKVKWSLKRIFCVGPSTLSSILDLFGISNDEVMGNFVTSSVGNAEDLAKVILEESGKHPIDLPLIYPGGNLQSDTLAERLNGSTIPFHGITTYRTIPNPNLAHSLESTLKDDDSSRRIYVFFSPSGINFTMPLLGRLDSAEFIAIGPSTRAALEKVPGIDSRSIQQCSNPTPEALMEIISVIIKVPLTLK